MKPVNGFSVTHGFSKHPLYSNWTHLKDRCDNPRNKQLKNTRKNKWFIATNLKTGEQIKERNIRGFARKYHIDNSAIAKCLKKILYKKVGNWTFKHCG